MKKIINSPDAIVSEMIQGYITCHSDSLTILNECNRVITKNKRKEKVGLVIGGGSGHEPLFLGYVGEGLADAVAVGNVFAAPSPNVILSAIKAVDCGQGVLCVFGNYAGDVLNFEMAKELAEFEGIRVANIIVRDDIASAPVNRINDRRGIAGDLYMIKLLGAATENGATFEECLKLSKKISDNLFSIGIGLTPGTHPSNGELGFYLAEDEMEFGLGIHGEPGIERRQMATANEISQLLIKAILEEKNTIDSKTIALCINGLGSTTLLELYIVSHDVHKLLKNKKYQVKDSLVGSYCTTQEMGGISLSIMYLDDELEQLLEQKAVSPHFHKGV